MLRLRSRPFEAGDLAILYENPVKMHQIYLQAGAIFNCRFGHFKHDDIIGKNPGSKVFSFSFYWKKKKNIPRILHNSTLH